MSKKTSIDICSEAAAASTDFERNNSELKKLYLIKNILLYNEVVKNVDGNCGTFGTGYPFYALGDNFEGQLPIINEQIRYNEELIKAVDCSCYEYWNCANCLKENGHIMPDLKQVCKTCDDMDDTLKPRKIINRLPDIDMWMVCDSSCIPDAKENLLSIFSENDMKPSDIDPLQTLEDIFSINNDLKSGIMPSRKLPVDVHIMEYNTLYSIIEKVPFVIKRAKNNCEIPYLPIHPISYRKKWQYDDVPYNFFYDYFGSFTDFNFKTELKDILIQTRKELVSTYTTEQLYKFLLLCGPDSAKRRYQTKELKKTFEERIRLW